MKTLRRVRGVAQLIDTLILTLPAMANVAALLFLAIFIFAALGNTTPPFPSKCSAYLYSSIKRFKNKSSLRTDAPLLNPNFNPAIHQG